MKRKNSNKTQMTNLQTDSRIAVRYAIYARILAAGLFICALIFLPYLADYYLLQPEDGFFSFYLKSANLLNYELEADLIYSFAFAVWFFTKKTGLSLCVSYLPMLLLTYASSIKYEMRGELLHLDDLKLTEAAGMAMQFLGFKCTGTRLFVLAATLIFCAGGIIADKMCKKFPLPLPQDSTKQKHLKYASAFLRTAAGCACAAMLCFHFHDFSNEVDMSSDSADVETAIDAGNDRYVLYNFLRNDSNAAIVAEQWEESYEFFQKKNSQPVKTGTDSDKMPSVIVIMNESWWNTDNISSNAVTFSSDPMADYKELAKTCSSGSLTSNVYGGGTIDSESEFLTGLNTKYFLADASISNELPKRKVPSIVDYFNALDYDTTAIHPYYGDFYNRDETYKNYGFDHVVFDEDMDYTDIYTRFISDESLANQIIKEYESDTSSKKKFIFSVSVGNHTRELDYKIKTVENYSYPVSVTIDAPSSTESERLDLTNSINGIYLANKAFAQLKSYFEKKDEPVVLVMYGDHIPSFWSSCVKAMGLTGNNEDVLRRTYSVPVLMWSNCNTEKIDFTGESINYLPQMLIEYAGLPETEMTQILRYERSVLKSNRRKFVTDADGNFIQSYNYKQMEAIRHFKIIDYDLLFHDKPAHPDVWKPKT